MSCPHMLIKGSGIFWLKKWFLSPRDLFWGEGFKCGSSWQTFVHYIISLAACGILRCFWERKWVVTKGRANFKRKLSIRKHFSQEFQKLIVWFHFSIPIYVPIWAKFLAFFRCSKTGNKHVSHGRGNRILSSKLDSLSVATGVYWMHICTKRISEQTGMHLNLPFQITK